MILLADVYEYLICPYKLSFGQNTIIDDLSYEQKIYKKLLRSVLLFKGKNNNITKSFINSSLGIIWEELKQKDQITDVRTSTYEIIYNNVDRIYNFVLDIGEIITISNKEYISFNDMVLCYDVLSMSRTIDGCIHFIYEFDESNLPYHQNNILYILLKYISKDLLKEISKAPRYVIHIFNSRTCRFGSIFSDIDNRKVKPILTELLKSINNKNYYPQASIQNCSLCLYKNSCSWKSI